MGNLKIYFLNNLDLEGDFRLRDFFCRVTFLYLGFWLAIGDFFNIGRYLSQALGIFIPEIGDFLKSGNFYSGDLVFFLIWGFFSPKFIYTGIIDFFKSDNFYPRHLYPGNWKIFEDFLSPGFFGDGDFFSFKKPPLILIF